MATANGSTSALEELELLITATYDKVYELYNEGADHNRFKTAMVEHLVALDGLRQDFEDNWVHADTEGEVPTVAQGVALARFLRPHFQMDAVNRGAFVSRGGQGLGDNYLYVRFNDGYEGGIAKDGSTST